MAEEKEEQRYTSIEEAPSTQNSLNPEFQEKVTAPAMSRDAYFKDKENLGDMNPSRITPNQGPSKASNEETGGADKGFTEGKKITVRDLLKKNRELSDAKSKGGDEYEEADAGYGLIIPLLQQKFKESEGENEEQRKAREKRENSKRIIAAISDGLSALGNLYYTSKYSPDMYNHRGETQSGALERKLEQARAEREKLNADHYNYALSLGNLLRQRAADKRAIAAQKAAEERAKRDDERKEEEYKFNKNNIWPNELKKKEKQAEKAGYDAEVSRWKAYFAPEEGALKVKNEKLRGQVYGSQIGKNNAQREAAERSNRLEYRAEDRNGKLNYFSSANAAKIFAAQEGTLETLQVREISSTDIDQYGIKSNKKTTKTKNDYYPSLGERQSLYDFNEDEDEEEGEALYE